MNVRISDAMRAQCDISMQNIIDFSLLKTFAFNVIDELRSRDLFELQDMRIPNSICTEIYNELRHDPFLQTIIEQFPLHVSDNIIFLISIACQGSTATVNVSLHS